LEVRKRKELQKESIQAPNGPGCRKWDKMGYENLSYEKKDGIAFITFNRPKVLNALNRKTIEELRDALLDAVTIPQFTS
jgi:1,4-dihydroxy-2-naphthoyl-CoA synthase